MPQTTPPLDKATVGLATLFLTSGTTHLVRPQVFEGIVPHVLPRKRALVYVSGAAEIACALGLLHSRTRKVAGLASAALLVAVFPANVQMTANHAKRAQRKQDTGSKAFLAGTVARLPMQWPMIRTALRAAGRL
ncbi:membrane protein [Knoellia flava TL1]|uniref:Membrane protein n=2 Tax=Knoellia flava TaxID=913969 RepID=A0A8H9FW62_9MICO|nr:MauE/DoxX family redox-associated membrane protein [Knoellia flava]KGN35105.1 membrane protein [Knoellia flava TL1]GGB86496.1 membrane protein [Knoellia flava]